MTLCKLLSGCVWLIVAMFLYLSPNIANAQFRVSDWKIYTSLWNTKAISTDNENNIWVATEGGAYKYNYESKEITEYRNQDALLSLDLNTIKVNPSNNSVFFGAKDGTIDILDSDNNWRHVLSIKDHGLASAGIYDFLFIENKVYVCGDFGIALYDSENDVFVENIQKIGTFQQNTTAYKMLLLDNKIWIATAEGVACINQDAPSFSPKEWTNYGSEDGLKDVICTDLAVYNDSIYVSSELGVFVLRDTVFEKVFDKEVISMELINDRLYFAELNGLSYDFGTYHENYQFNIENSVIAQGPNNTILIGRNNNGFGIFNLEKEEILTPNTPIFNHFKSISVDSNGDIWSCDDGANGGLGFAYFKNNKWINYTKALTPWIWNANQYFNVETFPNGRLAFNSWGMGLLYAKIENDTVIFEHFYKDNSPIQNSFAVIGQAKMDRSNKLWFINRGENFDGPLLISYDETDGFMDYPNRHISKRRQYLFMDIDFNGTKWLGSDGNEGLYYFNEMGTPNNPSDDKFGTLTTSNSNILDVNHTAVEVDKQGNVWVGTSFGCSVILNPQAALSSNPNFIIRQSVNDLKDKFVNDIMIDALDNKWFATNDGIYVLDSEGSSPPLAILDMSNSPLPSNEIISLAADDATGIIYIGTKKGMLTVQSLSVQPEKDYSIKCYPQPFNPQRDSEMIVEGLVADTDLRVVTLDGQLVKKLTARGRVAVWNGTNERNEKVKSGIYLILAESESKSTNAVQKIAVINK